MTPRRVLEHFAPWYIGRDLSSYTAAAASMDSEVVRQHLSAKHHWFVLWSERATTSASELLAIHRELHAMELQIETGKP